VLDRRRTRGRSGGVDAASGGLAGRGSRWWAGWRVAVRMARRDVRRHKVRSALIAVMVGLPVLLLTAGATLIASNDVNTVESIPRVMGATAARVAVDRSGTNQQVAQNATGSGTTNASRPLATLPGHRAGSVWTPAQIGSLLGARALPVLTIDSTVRVGEHRLHPVILGVDGRDPAIRPMVSLLSGRWPAASGEVLVTAAGRSHGLPATGRFSLKLTKPNSGKNFDTTATVIGTAEALAPNQKPDLVTLPQTVDLAGAAWDFLIDRSQPVTWSDVRRLNAYGLTVASRQVFLHPPTRDELDPTMQRDEGGSSGTGRAVVVLLAVGILIETTLLAGPAFAVSAARQRHSLALAASNGAQARQLRRSVLGQALVLGVLAAVVSVALGAGVAAAAIALWTLHDPAFDVGPFDVPGVEVGAILLCAVLAALVAALLPARGIGRLDIVGVLRGRVGAGRPRRGLPVAGVLVMVAGGAVCILAARYPGAETVAAAAAVVLVLGALMVIPVILAFAGRLGGRLPLALRLATRDTARQRGRSTPAVAAIMAAVAGLTALSIGYASDNEQAMREYQPRVPMGQGQIYTSGSDAASLTATVRRAAPDLAVQALGQVGFNGGNGPSRTTQTVLSAQPPGCTAQASIALDDPSTNLRCVRLGTSGLGERTAIAVMTGAGAATQLGLGPAQRGLLDRGGVLVADQALITGGRLAFVRGSQRGLSSDSPPPPTVTQRLTVPAAAVPASTWEQAFPQSAVGAIVTDRTARSLHWAYDVTQVLVRSPTGAISTADEQQVNDRLGDESQLYVERGFQRHDAQVMAILFGVAALLVLIAALISTALSLAESDADMSTLAAIGATRRTRRAFAASQAFVVTLAGCVIGVLVGLTPGIAVTWPLTRTVNTVGNPPTVHDVVHGPYVDIPWWQLLCVVALVPLVAAGLSALAVRRAPRHGPPARMSNVRDARALV